MVTYGLVILPPLWIGALIIEWLLGQDYDGVAVVIWTMSVFPVLRIIQSLPCLIVKTFLKRSFNLC